MRCFASSPFRTLPALLLFAVTLPACGDGGAAPADAGAGDHGPVDQGTTDLGSGDAGPDELGDCVAGFTPVTNAQYASTNRFRTADGTIELAFVIQPDPDAFGTSGTTVFLARAVAVSIDGAVHCVTNPAELDYQVSHHNFDDTLTVTVLGSEYTWKVDLEDYGNVPSYALTVAPPAGQPSELALTALGCSTAPGDHRCFGPESW
jgi:hypothetical protein